jgi:hypothetical protein
VPAAAAQEMLKADPRAASYISMGYSPTVVSLALAYQAASKSAGDTVVLDFCKNYIQLTAMGFPPGAAAGALAVAKNNMQAATEALLPVG